MQPKNYRSALLLAASLTPMVGIAASDAAAGKAGRTDVSAASLEEIVVVSNRYEATDLQLKSPNITSVLSAEDLDNSAVRNVAEALGMLPGVNVVNTSTAGFVGGISDAARGQGQYVSLRGLNGEYNVNLINGVEVAQSSPHSRQVKLSLLPPSGLKTIVLNKTSFADMNGDAIGGTVDFRTPTGFDFDSAHTSVMLGGLYDGRADDYGKNNDGFGYTVHSEIARRFGANGDFAIYASAYYDERNYAASALGGASEATCCDNGWSFAVFNADGSNPAGIDPGRNLQLNAANVGASSGLDKRYGGNVSLDWSMSESTYAYFRGSFARINSREDNRWSQIVGMNVAKDAESGAAQVGTTDTYRPVINGVSTRYWYETNPETATLHTAQLGFDTKVGRWTYSPNVFYTWGSNDRPNHIEISARNNSVQGGDISDDGFPYGQTTLFTYDSENIPRPMLTPAMLASMNNLLNLPANDRGQVTRSTSDQTKSGARFDVRYEMGEGAMQYVKFGGKYVHASRDVTWRNWTIPGRIVTTPTGYERLGDLPIWSTPYTPVFPGKFGWPDPDINQGALFAYYQGQFRPEYLDTCGSNDINNYNCNTEQATEDVMAVYAMTQFNVGNLEIIPGVRYEHTDVDNRFWVTPFAADGTELLGSFQSTSGSFEEVLPSIFVNYRPDSNRVYRAGIWRSYTRPPFDQLGGGGSTSRSANGVTTISRGNPDLKSITATNFDLSGEWDWTTGTHLMVSGFYKKLQNVINDSENTTEQVGQGTGTIISQPVNGNDGKVYGVELAARQVFKFLPLPFDGLGVSAVVSRQYTSVDLGDPSLSNDERILNVPDWLANIEVFYTLGGLSLGVVYNYSSEYIEKYDYIDQPGSWDDLWQRSRRRVDLHAGYEFQSGLEVDLSIGNLLKDYIYWSHIGRDSLAISDVIDTGITGRLTTTYKF
jgi:TonB-dependent receptor